MLPAKFVDVNRSPSRTDDGSLSDYFFRLTPIPTNVPDSSIVTQHARSREPFSTAPLASDPDFVNRPEILAWIRNKCAEPGARAALVGLGGIGKSQLAIQYAHNVRDATPHIFVFWVHASTKARFEEAYRNIADKLELQGRDNPKMDIVRLLSSWLCDEANGQWTMILDNVDEVETFYPSRKREQGNLHEISLASLADYLPQSRNGSILITSRSKDTAARLVGGYENIKEVLAMEESQGLQLLCNKLQDTSNEESAVDLLCTLDYVPFAITQAAAYINRRVNMTIVGYLSEFRANDKEKESLLNWDAGDVRWDQCASNSVVTTWQMSFERIRQERRSAADLLSLMSFFNPQGIPKLILQRHSMSKTETGDEDDAGSALDEDLDTLQSYCLIAATADRDVYEMHALVQSCTRAWLSLFGCAEWWKQKFVELMAQAFPTGRFENWTNCRQLLPHIEPLCDTEPATDKLVEERAQVLTNVAWYLCMKGSCDAAEKIAMAALAARESVLGPDDEWTLRSVVVLGVVLQYQRKYEEAEKLNRRALAGTEKKLGAQHPGTLTSVGNLAVALQDQGKYEEAEKLNRRALEGWEMLLGAHHSLTRTTFNNLAMVLRYQGKYDEVEKLNWRELEVRGEGARRTAPKIR